MDAGSAVLPIIGVVTALVALVTLFVKYLISVASKADADCRERVTKLETRVERLETDVNSERTAKHKAMADSSAYLGTIRVVRHLFETLEPDAFSIALPKLLAAVPDSDRTPIERPSS